MCNEKITGMWLPTVKKTVDSVYEYLIQHPEGITMAANEYGKRGSRVCTKLVSRGIIEKKGLGIGKGWRYKWVATMAPTKVLYGSIAQELYDEERKYQETFKKKHAAKNKETPAVQPEEEKTPDNPSDPSLVEIAQSIGTTDSRGQDAGSIDDVLSRYSMEEIWGYMKRHGVSVNGTISYTTTTYLQ